MHVFSIKQFCLLQFYSHNLILTSFTGLCSKYDRMQELLKFKIKEVDFYGKVYGKLSQSSVQIFLTG